MEPTVHELKSWPTFFDAITGGVKTHELRNNDRNFRIGDTLILKEYTPETSQYTGRISKVIVTYITEKNIPCAESQHALHEKFAILSIRLLD